LPENQPRRGGDVPKFGRGTHHCDLPPKPALMFQ
jgi:hypothetical protein